MSDNHIRILLIEDNPGDARLIKEMLNEAQRAPFILEWRESLSAGLQKLAEDGADVVLLDLELPDSQGLDTYQKLHRQFPGVPIVVLSGLSDESVAVKTVRDGAQDYLVKGQIEGKLLSRSVMYAMERKRSEMAVERLGRQFELILNSAGEGIFGLDLNGNHTFVNPLAAKMLGYAVDELTALHSHSTIHHSRLDGSTYPEKYCPICATLKDGISYNVETEVFWRKDGSSFPIRYISTPIKQGNEITGAVVSFVDITERKQTENLLRARLHLMDFATSHSIEEVLQKTLDEIGEIVDSPIGFYHFVGEDQKTLSLQAWSTRTLREFCTVSGKGLHYNVQDAGVWVDCIHQRAPVIHNDYASLTHRKGMPEGHAHVTRELVVPIMRSHRIVAILGVGNKSSDYTERDVELVTYMADVAWEIVEHKRAVDATVRAKEEWELTFDSVPDLIAIIDKEYRIRRVNKAMAQRLGRTAGECVELLCYEAVHGVSGPLENCPISRTLKDGLQHSGEIHEGCLGGDFVISSTPLYNESGQMIGAVHVAHDITERKRAEVELKKVNRALKTISVCNEALVHAVEESAFLQKICDLLIEEGGYRMAWIGYAEQQGDNRVLPLVHAGHEDGYLSTVNITWKDVERGRGPTGTAVRTCSVCVQNDISTNPDFAPWREEALKRGYSSTIAFPLIAYEQSFGVLTIYAPERDVFIDEEIRLLKELADDVAFGILTIRMREERYKAQEELRTSHEHLHHLAAHMQSVREEERASIAREVHDELGQILTALKFNWVRIAAKLKDIDEPLHKAVSGDVELIDKTISTVKKICTELRPGILDHLGLGPAIEWQVHEFQQRSGIECELVLSSEEVTDDKNLGIALFRILQEALTNILRHSKATKVKAVLAEQDNSIVFEISDNGIGITEKDLSKSNSFGLVGMRERVYPWKGDVQITGDRIKGTNIKISIPKDKDGGAPFNNPAIRISTQDNPGDARLSEPNINR
jgi:PAS domain S-box-containing protein